MSQAERGLFERIKAGALRQDGMANIWHIDFRALREICAEFELAYDGLKNALEHERKCHHAAQDRIIDLEQRLAEAESALKWCYDRTTKQLVKPVMSFEEWREGIKEELTAPLPEKKI